MKKNDRVKLSPASRRKQLLDCAVEAARTRGYQSLRQKDVAKIAKTTTPLVQHYFKKMALLRRSVLKEGIARGVVEIIVQAMGVGDPLVLAAPTELRQQALIFLINKYLANNNETRYIDARITRRAKSTKPL